jgi:hypothetical protein
LVDVLLDLVFEVTTIVATHNVPPTNPLTVTGLLAVEEDIFEENTIVLPNCLLTVTSIVTPSYGIVEVILAFIRREAPTTGNTFE